MCSLCRMATKKMKGQQRRNKRKTMRGGRPPSNYSKHAVVSNNKRNITSKNGTEVTKTNGNNTPKNGKEVTGNAVAKTVESTNTTPKNTNAGATEEATNAKAANTEATEEATEEATNAVANNSTATNSPNISAMKEKAKKLRAIATLAKTKADSAAQHADEAEKALTEAGGNVSE